MQRTMVHLKKSTDMTVTNPPCRPIFHEERESPLPVQSRTGGEWFDVISVAQGGLVFPPRPSALPPFLFRLGFPGWASRTPETAPLAPPVRPSSSHTRMQIGTKTPGKFPLQHPIKLRYFKFEVLNS